MPISLKKLRKLVKRYGVWEDKKKGKGSHTTFLRETSEGTFTYPIPNRKDVYDSYVEGLRRRLRLTPEDGVEDDEFFDK